MKLINKSFYHLIVILKVLLISLLFTQCGEVKSYEQLVKKEMSSGVQIDTLFLGIYFGMPSKDFYKHCWELNRKGALRDGFGNTTAAFELTELKAPARFEFYPSFTNDKISAMPAFVQYDAWAPWNKELAAPLLLEEAKVMLQRWYNVTFYPIVPRSIFGKAYVGVTGNLKIVLYYTVENKVEIAYTDLRNGDDVPVVFKSSK